VGGWVVVVAWWRGGVVVWGCGGVVVVVLAAAAAVGNGEWGGGRRTGEAGRRAEGRGREPCRRLCHCDGALSAAGRAGRSLHASSVEIVDFPKHP
jgi:hypothetical protein